MLNSNTVLLLFTCWLFGHYGIYTALLNQYFSWVFNVEIYDLLDEVSIEDDIVVDLLRGIFEYCDVMVTYYKVDNEDLNFIENRFDTLPPLPPDNESLNNDTSTKIRLDHEYGVGLVFITNDTQALFEFIGSNITNNIVESNIVAIVMGTCNNDTMKLTEFFVKTCWYSYFMSHLIVLHNDCSKLAYFDVIVNKVEWLDFADLPGHIEDLVVFDTYDYREYPIRISIFRRFPTVLGRHEVAHLPLPGYIPKMYKYATNQTGIDAIVLSYLVERLNFKPVLYNLNNSYYGGIDTKTGEIYGTLGDVIYNLTDIAFNGRYVKGYGADDKIEFLSYTGFDKICVITPKALLIPRWKAPLLIFEITAWTAMGGLVLGSSIFWYFAKKYKTRPDVVHHSFVQTVIDISLLLISQPLPIVPLLRSKEKLMAIPFLFASFYISGIFQGMLTSLTSTVNYEKDITTFKELSETDYLITSTSTAYADLFGEDPVGITKQLASKLVIYKDRPLSSMSYPALFRNCCAVERDGDARFSIQRLYSDSNGKPLLNVMNECPRAYFLGAIIRKSWPFRSDFSRVIRKFKEYGLLNKWYSDIKDVIIRHQQIESVKNGIIDDGAPEPFTLSHLMASFYLLGIGLGCAFLAFIFEIIFGVVKVRVKQNQRFEFVN